MLYYTIYTPNFAQTAIHPGGAEYINNKSPPQCAAQDPTAKHRYFKAKKKKKNTLTTWFWSFYNDTRLPVEGLGQIWGGWKERGQSLQQTTGLAVAPGVKFIDFRQSHLHPYLRKHRCPFCREAQLMEKSAKWRETWVGGMAERATGREGRKKKRFYCVSLMVFSESKWATDEKKQDVQRQHEGENKMEKLSHQA